MFSLNARNSRLEYISLELNEGKLKLIHSQPNGYKIIDIPAKINDGKWHQLAISVENSSSVRTYLDCNWITTQILRKDSLQVPPDTDLIVGYMFQGALEQLTISNAANKVSEQCGATSEPIRDSETLIATERPLLRDEIDIDNNDYLDEEYVDLDWQPDHNHIIEKKVKKSIPLLPDEIGSGDEEEPEVGSGDFGQHSPKYGMKYLFVPCFEMGGALWVVQKISLRHNLLEI